MMRNLTVIAAALCAACVLPGVASADFVLDTGTPTGTSSPPILNSSQSFGGAFMVTAGEDITSLAAYLTIGTGTVGDTFTYNIYSNNGFTSRPSGRPAAVFSATGTFSANGWNSTAVNWVPTTAGEYWLTLQVTSPTQTKGLDLPLEASAGTGSVPALGFAFAGSSGQFSTSGAPSIGLEVTSAAPVPLPAAVWLLASGLLGLGSAARRRKLS